jgi:hypothetical protein
MVILAGKQREMSKYTILSSESPIPIPFHSACHETGCLRLSAVIHSAFVPGSIAANVYHHCLEVARFD